MKEAQAQQIETNMTQNPQGWRTEPPNSNKTRDAGLNRNIALLPNCLLFSPEQGTTAVTTTLHMLPSTQPVGDGAVGETMAAPPWGLPPPLPPDPPLLLIWARLAPSLGLARLLSGWPCPPLQWHPCQVPTLAPRWQPPPPPAPRDHSPVIT